MTVELIQRELMAHGSVSTAYDIFEDFFLYKSGIYIVWLSDPTLYTNNRVILARLRQN